MQQPGDFLGPMAKIYSEEQCRALESHFRMDRYPSPEAQEALAARLNLKKFHVQVWFRRHRATCLQLKTALRVQRLQGLRPLPSPTESTHFLLCCGSPACPAPDLRKEPRPELKGEGSPGATPPGLNAPDAQDAPDAQGTLEMLLISTRTPRFREGGTPEDQDESEPAGLGSSS